VSDEESVRWHKWQRQQERRYTLALLFGIAVVAGILYFTRSYAISVRLAAVGGTVSTFGVVVMALPVLRVGVFQWIANAAFSRNEGFASIDHMHGVPREFWEDQAITDKVNQQVFGPCLVGIGTIINGFSGLF
jgi:hypothetical protein